MGSRAHIPGVRSDRRDMKADPPPPPPSLRPLSPTPPRLCLSSLNYFHKAQLNGQPTGREEGWGGGGGEGKSRRGDKRERRSSVDKRDQLIRLTKIE